MYLHQRASYLHPASISPRKDTWKWDARRRAETWLIARMLPSTMCSAGSPDAGIPFGIVFELSPLTAAMSETLHVSKSI